MPPDESLGDFPTLPITRGYRFIKPANGRAPQVKMLEFWQSDVEILGGPTTPTNAAVGAETVVSIMDDHNTGNKMPQPLQPGATVGLLTPLPESNRMVTGLTLRTRIRGKRPPPPDFFMGDSASEGQKSKKLRLRSKLSFARTRTH